MFSKIVALVTTIGLLPILARAAIWDVTVGGTAGLVYTPPYVNAAVGDRVHFIFNAKNHTVTQSSFQAPCVPLLGGVNTGFNYPVSPNLTSNFPTFDIIVPNTEPFWIHCQQTDHCPQGMVFAINPPPVGNTFAAFLAAALALNGTSTTTTTTTSAATSTYGATSWGGGAALGSNADAPWRNANRQY